MNFIVCLIATLWIIVNGQEDSNSVCFCNLIYDPWCCDGDTYSNQCFAECQGKNIADCYHNEC